MNKLAIQGGKPIRTLPFPKRSPFGPEEIREVTKELLSLINSGVIRKNRGIRGLEGYAAFLDFPAKNYTKSWKEVLGVTDKSCRLAVAAPHLRSFCKRVSKVIVAAAFNP